MPKNANATSDAKETPSGFYSKSIYFEKDVFQAFEKFASARGESPSAMLRKMMTDALAGGVMVTTKGLSAEIGARLESHAVELARVLGSTPTLQQTVHSALRNWTDLTKKK